MDAAQEVKSRLDVADIVGEYLSLKPAGSGSFKALCPFHNEKTPSFYVNRPRQSWHCFGCDKGGDIISFVMDMEGMAFRDALEHLAQKAGVTLPAQSPADMQRAGERKRLHEVNELAARFFRAQLLQSPGAESARAYAAKRGIDDLTGDLFKIGYAPNEWDTLTKALLARDVTADELVRAGLSVKNEERGSVYDRFRGRLMFTIQDVHGNVVGFTGRLLDPDAKEAKYVNTPETAAYKKSMVLYGLDKAKGDIKRQNLAVIVEGNMDVVSSHKAGVTNVVCSSGTALTDEQLHLLQRFTKNLAIAFDADSAGTAATVRGLDLARAQDFNVKIITLPPEAGKDPDDAINKNVELWKQAIHDATDIMDWVFRSAFKGRNIGNPDDKKLIADQVLPEIRRITNPVVQDHWLNKLANGMATGVDSLRESLRRTPSTHTRPHAPTPSRPSQTAPQTAAPKAPDRERDLAERILSILISKPELFKDTPETLKMALPEPLGPLYGMLQQAYDAGQSDGTTSPPLPADEPTQRLVDYLTIRADRDFPDQKIQTLHQELTNAIEQLQQLHSKKARQQIAIDLKAAEAAKDQSLIKQLTDKFQQLIGK